MKGRHVSKYTLMVNPNHRHMDWSMTHDKEIRHKCMITWLSGQDSLQAARLQRIYGNQMKCSSQVHRGLRIVEVSSCDEAIKLIK